jgi:Uma2 family endonuclease
MTTTLPETTTPAPPKRRRFGVAEYYRMAEAGILKEDERVELIEGEIIEMSPIGTRHAACVDRINRLFSRLASRDAIIRVQSPVRLDDASALQPDVTLLRLRDDFYERMHPTPPDVLLVVEVADTSAGYDREVKARLYARAGIQEFWLVDLTGEKIEVYARPSEGSYTEARKAARGESIASHAFAGLTVGVDEILG